MGILQGTIYNPDSLNYNTVTFSASLLTKDDVRRMRRFLRKFGYQIDQGDAAMLRTNELSLTVVERSQAVEPEPSNLTSVAEFSNVASVTGVQDVELSNLET